MKIWVPFPEIIFRMPYLRDTRKDATRKISGHAGKNQETGKAWGNGEKKRRQEKSRKTGRTCVCVCMGRWEGEESSGNTKSS